MTIPKSRREKIVSVISALILGAAGNAIWAGIIRLASLHMPRIPSSTLDEVLNFFGFVMCSFIGILLGRRLERDFSFIPSPLRPKIRQSQTFVLEVQGTQPLDSKISDWKFFLTNCTSRILRSVELSSVRSDIGAYELTFSEIPVMQPRERVHLTHELFPRRMADQDSHKKVTLWDFATDITGLGRSSFIWYDIGTRYRDEDDDSVRDGGVVGICFDLPDKKLKTEGAEYYRNNRLL